MYTYSQKTAILCRDGVMISSSGHAGNGAGLNNPAMQDVHNIGPLPRGRYKIGPWQACHGQLGEIVAPLVPLRDDNGSFDWLSGRGGFYIHGPELSEGCMVQQHDVRLSMSSSGDADLEVTE